MTDNIIQQVIAGHNMANEMRAQHRQQVRNDRAGGTRTLSHMVPTALQQMTALSQGRPMEPPLQASVHNPDPLGLFPNSSLFAGPIMVPQQAEAPVASTQQIEVSASRSPVVTTPDLNANRTRTPFVTVDEVPVIFDGGNRTRTTCQEELEDGERVVRLRCRRIFHSECWMSAMVNHGAPLDGDDDPDCPNCRGQGATIAPWNFIDANQVTQPGAAWSDLMPDLDNDLPDLISPDESDTGLINHGQSNPGQTVQPDPRQAFQAAPVEQTTNRGRRNFPV